MVETLPAMIRMSYNARMRDLIQFNYMEMNKKNLNKNLCIHFQEKFYHINVGTMLIITQATA